MALDPETTGRLRSKYTWPISSSFSNCKRHYYWHPVRCRFGRPGMDLYELRHFCASWLFNDLGLPAQDVAHQLGHTDGGALVQKLYGHPSESLARERIKRAAGGGSSPPLVKLSEVTRRHDGSEHPESMGETGGA